TRRHIRQPGGRAAPDYRSSLRSVEAMLEAFESAPNPDLHASDRSRKSRRHFGMREAVVVGEREALPLRSLDLTKAVTDSGFVHSLLQETERVGSFVGQLVNLPVLLVMQRLNRARTLAAQHVERPVAYDRREPRHGLACRIRIAGRALPDVHEGILDDLFRAV